jgi:hypothetical protein
MPLKQILLSSKILRPWPDESQRQSFVRRTAWKMHWFNIKSVMIWDD